MKINLGILFLIIQLLFSCKNESNLNGNYSICFNGEYSEAYFKQDSMRVASESEWIKLSEWRKIEIKGDTINFETFGEWRDNRKAILRYTENSMIEFLILETDEKLKLIPINDDLNFYETDEFWNQFTRRRISFNCK